MNCEVQTKTSDEDEDKTSWLHGKTRFRVHDAASINLDRTGYLVSFVQALAVYLCQSNFNFYCSLSSTRLRAYLLLKTMQMQPLSFPASHWRDGLAAHCQLINSRASPPSIIPLHCYRNLNSDCEQLKGSGNLNLLEDRARCSLYDSCWCWTCQVSARCLDKEGTHWKEWTRCKCGRIAIKTALVEVTNWHRFLWVELWYLYQQLKIGHTTYTWLTLRATCDCSQMQLQWEHSDPHGLSVLDAASVSLFFLFFLFEDAVLV